MEEQITYSHRLILPSDSNHYGTLYAGSLLRIGLEAAYATANRTLGESANIVLRRVLNVECYLPVPTGSLVELRGAPLYRTAAYLVVGIVGMPLNGQSEPWMDALFGFCQVDESGRPAPLPEDPDLIEDNELFQSLEKRLHKLVNIKSKQ